MITDKQLEKELSMQKHMDQLKSEIVPFVMDDLEAYAKEKGDSPERVILRATEILIGMYRHQFNLSIANILQSFGFKGEIPYYEKADGSFDIEGFNADWIFKAGEFEDIE